MNFEYILPLRIGKLFNDPEKDKPAGTDYTAASCFQKLQQVR
jgi:hypothetical protein